MTEPIYAALVAAQRAVVGQAHDAKNQHHQYRYTSAEALIAEGRRALTTAGLALVEQTADRLVGEDGYPYGLTVRYLLVHESGAMPVGPWTVPVICDKGRPPDKAEASARTYALGYTLRGLLLIDRPDDDDAVDKRDDRGRQPPPEPRANPAARRLSECMTPDELRVTCHANRGRVANLDDAERVEAVDRVRKAALRLGMPPHIALGWAGLPTHDPETGEVAPGAEPA